jgi:hypothetical protein
MFLYCIASRPGVKVPHGEGVLVSNKAISAAQPDPFGGKPMSRLEYVLRGIKKNESEKGVGSRERLPITPSLLLRMKAKWEPSGGAGGRQDVMGSLLSMFFRILARGGDDGSV